MAYKPTLGYWGCRSLAEGIRLLLTYLEVDFEYKQYIQGEGPEFDISEWVNSVDSLGLDFPNLPYFIDGDLKISETIAIYEYIALKYKPELLGETVQEKAIIKQVGLILHEMRVFINMTFYNPDYQNLIDPNLNASKDEFAKLAKFLGDKKFLFGEKESWVDFPLYTTLLLLDSVRPGLVTEISPKFHEFKARFEQLPHVQEFYTRPVLPWNNKSANWGGHL